MFAIVGRLLYSTIAALWAPFLKLDPKLIYSNALTQQLISPHDPHAYALFGVWQRFDTLWYAHIAQSGYDIPEAIVFYPLYPLLIRLSHLPSVAGALVLATLSAFLFAWGFLKLVALDYPADVGMRGLLMYLAWPTGFILFAGYPESLLMCSIVWAIYAARTGNTWLTALAAFLAAGTKAFGALVFLPIAWIAIRERKWRLLLASATSFVAPIAMAVWFRSLWHTSAQQVYATYWHTTICPPWQSLWYSLARPDISVIFNMLILTVTAIFAFGMAGRAEQSAFAVALFAVLLSTRTLPPLHSMSRYTLMVFPAFINGGRQQGSRTEFGVFLAVLFLMEMFVFYKFLEWGFMI